MSSLMDSAARALAKLSLKTEYDGATVKTVFTVGTRQGKPSIDFTYEILKTRNLERGLKPEELTALDTLVREAVGKTKSIMIEKNMYNQEEFCPGSLQELCDFYNHFMKEDLDSKKISIVTNYKAGNETQESLCLCQPHKVLTGESLAGRGLAIVARLEGGQCASRYHVVTNPTVKAYILHTPHLE
jgi:hypothetical protein